MAVQQAMLMVSGGYVAACTEANTFLARTSGLNLAHQTAYSDLICGLVADGVWSKIDVLQVYATQDSATAVLNLKSSSYTAVTHGSPTFTADRGFTGVDGSSTVYIDTGFNPRTAPSPNFVQNSAHMSYWNLTNTTSTTQSCGSNDGVTNAYMYAKFPTGSLAACRLNSVNGAGITRVTGDPRGYWLGNRSSSSSLEIYFFDGTLYVSGSDTSAVSPNLNFYTIGVNNSGTPAGAGYQHAMFGCGSSFNATEAGNYYSRLRTYLTAVGAPLP